MFSHLSEPTLLHCPFSQTTARYQTAKAHERLLGLGRPDKSNHFQWGRPLLLRYRGGRPWILTVWGPETLT